MSRQEIETVINARLAEQKKSILNRNAMDALFAAFPEPLGALGKIFVGRQDALDKAKQGIAQDVMLDLLCRIDESLTHAMSRFDQGAIEISGLIEAIGVGGDSLVGVEIGENAGPVTFKGAHVRVEATDVKRVTGLKINVVDRVDRG